MTHYVIDVGGNLYELIDVVNRIKMSKYVQARYVNKWKWENNGTMINSLFLFGEQ